MYVDDTLIWPPCIYLSIYRASSYLPIHMHMWICRYPIMYVCMYACMFVCMHVCNQTELSTQKEVPVPFWLGHGPTRLGAHPGSRSAIEFL